MTFPVNTPEEDESVLMTMSGYSSSVSSKYFFVGERTKYEYMLARTGSAFFLGVTIQESLPHTCKYYDKMMKEEENTWFESFGILGWPHDESHPTTILLYHFFIDINVLTDCLYKGRFRPDYRGIRILSLDSFSSFSPDKLFLEETY